MEATGKTRAVLAIPGALVSSLLTLGLLRWGLQRVLAPAGAVGQVGTAWILLGATLLLVLGLAWGLGRWLRPGWAPVLGQVVAPLAVGIPPFLLALGFLILDGQWVPGDALVDQLLVALPPALALGLAPLGLVLASRRQGLGAILAGGAALAGSLGGVLGMLAPVEIAFGRVGWGAALADPVTAPATVAALVGGLAVLNLSGQLLSRWLSALAALAGGTPAALGSRRWASIWAALVLVVLLGSLLAPLVAQERDLAQAWQALVWRPLWAALVALGPGLGLGLAAGRLAARQRPKRWWGGLASDVVLLPAEVVAAVPALALLLVLSSTTAFRMELLLAFALWPRCARVVRTLVADGLPLRQVVVVTLATAAGTGALWFGALQFLGRTSSAPLVTVATPPQVLASAAPLLLLASIPWLLLAAALSGRGREVVAEVYR